MIYLASPYSDPDPEVKEARFEAVCREAAILMQRGILVFSPIAHSHPITKHGTPSDWHYWKEFDRHIIGGCRGLWVLTLDGWRESVGVRAEIGLAIEFDKPTRLIDSGDGEPYPIPGLEDAVLSDE